MITAADDAPRTLPRGEADAQENEDIQDDMEIQDTNECVASESLLTRTGPLRKYSVAPSRKYSVADGAPGLNLVPRTGLQCWTPK